MTRLYVRKSHGALEYVAMSQQAAHTDAAPMWRRVIRATVGRLLNLFRRAIK